MANVYGDSYVAIKDDGSRVETPTVISGLDIGHYKRLVALASDGKIDPSLVAGGSGIGDMLRANNLSDVDSVVLARSNLGLGSAALLSALAVAQTANNLSDLANPGTARTNLGLTSIAVVTPGTGVNAALAINVGSAGAFVVQNGALGTPSSGVATNLTGTAAGLTAGNVTTNANLTGPITSVGNATAVASQTGIGTKFVMDTSPTLVTPILGVATCTSISDGGGNLRTIPQQSKSADYTLVLADAGYHIYHPASDANARTFTIPANASVAFPIGTAVTFVNLSANSCSIAITTDTMTLVGTGATGTRTLAQYGQATALKVASTAWTIQGTNLT